MIDGYAQTSIFIRAVAAMLLVYVIYKQTIILHQQSTLQWLKILLASLVALMLFNAVFTISTNFHRQADGNLSEDVRHLSLIMNAISSLASASILAIIYRKN